MSDVQTVTQAVTQPVNWWAIGASSAVISAVVNGGFKWWGEHTARRDERAKLAAQRAPAQLKVALMLEAFAKQAAGYLDGSEARVQTVYAERHGGEWGASLPWIPMAFEMASVDDWSAVPIQIYSECHELPLALTASDDWIRSGVKEEWLDVLDALRLDGQRAILYGYTAGALANQIRAAIQVPASTLSMDCFQRLERALDRRRDEYVRTCGRVELIPDLKARFRREYPDLVVESDASPALAGR